MGFLSLSQFVRSFSLGARKTTWSAAGVTFTVVCNSAGHAAFFQAGAWSQFTQALQHHGTHADNLPWPMSVRAPVAVASPPSTSQCAAWRAVQPESAQLLLHTVTPQLVVPAANTRALKWDSLKLVAVDGSAKDGHAGAGVVFPPTSLGGAPRCVQVRVGQGSSLKAELVALCYATKHFTADEVLTLTCDCSAALNAIEAGLLDSASMRHHAEERLLRTVVANVRARTASTLFVKVKAHIGLTLNELADTTAALARKADMATAPAPSPNVAVDLAEMPHTPILVVTATGERCKPADVAERLCEVKAAQIRDGETERLARVAAKDLSYAVAVAAGAQPAQPLHKGPSLAYKAVVAATEQDIVKPSTFNHRSIRVPPRAAKTWHKCRAGQRPRGAHTQHLKCRLCSKLVLTYAHARGDCDHEDIEALQTDGHDQTVHAMARAFRAKLPVTSTLLVNAGTKYSPTGTMDHTVPDWMLPFERWGAPGHRKFPDKPDMMLIVGWTQGTPPPVDKKSVKLFMLEFTSTNDRFLITARNLKDSKYAPLVGALYKEGWRVYFSSDRGDDWFTDTSEVNNVEPGEIVEGYPPHVLRGPCGQIHTVVIGHCGTHLTSNIETFTAFGLSSKEVLALLRETVALSAKQLHSCVANHLRLSASATAPVGVG